MTIQQLSFQINKLNHEIEELTKENQSLWLKYDELKGKYDKIKEKKSNDIKIPKPEVKTESADKQSIDSLTNLKNKIFQDFENNKTKKDPCAYSYSQETYEFCHLLQNISNNAYETLRNVFILPSRKSIDDNFKKNERKLASYIQDFKKFLF